MAASPLPGKLYLEPTTAGAGGTQIVGISEDRIEWEDGIETRHVGAGLDSDDWETLRAPSEMPPRLIIPVRDVSSVTLQLLFSLLSTGTGMKSHGANTVGIHGVAPGWALALRANVGNEILYSPRWKLHAESVKRIVWSRSAMRYEGSELMLAPHRSLDGKRAFMLDTAANIDAYYELGEEE